MTKWVYNFGDGKAEGNASMKELLGGKGANLAEMCNLGIAVPSGFTIHTGICEYYYKNNKQHPADLEQQIKTSIKIIEKSMNANFGDSSNPLLLSVRSGARASMPGMMDTILNLGLNDQTVEGLAIKSNNKRFAYDSYRRFIQMYSDVVLGIDHYLFEEVLDHKKMTKAIINDTELEENDLDEIIQSYKKIVLQHTNKEFPNDVYEQLWGAISAVCDSWMNNRAITYRKLNDIPQEWGTAVNIQAMVFGNMGETSATGVAFTRDPSTGANEFFGEYLINAQGEDVVAGIRTPQQITIAGKIKNNSNLPAMEEAMPIVYQELVDIYKKLELHYRDMQDIEFTVQNGKLWLLQTRSGKRTARAAIKIAVDMVAENLVDKKDAILRVNPISLDQLLHPTLDPKAKYEILDKGLPASPGAASGAIVFSADEAEKRSSKQKVILVRIETSPEDIHGMIVSEGILTSRGGMTSHAAVVARGMGKCCVCGAGNLNIDYDAKTLFVNGHLLKEGDIITLNGGTGEVILGEVKTIQPDLSQEFEQIMNWADEFRTIKVRTNAETEEDAKTARRFGAEGIGLCRTEHMFFDNTRIIAIREMIVASSPEERAKSLSKLLPYQKADFKAIFATMDGLPVTIRLLDPPLHEFVPHSENEIKEVADSAGVSVSDVKQRLNKLKESNPMLGHRGCRLAISYPEIYEMQTRAILEAAYESIDDGVKVYPEIMIPLVMSGKELAIIKELVENIAKELQDKHDGKKIDYLIGTMIELPRAAIMAGDIAQHAEFFSFGTNDLTQTTLGISRDDAGNFIEDYKSKKIFDVDPFVRIDEEGVGELVKMAIERGKLTRKGLKIGICGEHGGNPESIKFFVKSGLEYVSCSPYRVPVARLAAAHAAIEFQKVKVNV
jgi:pyruvate, orthophosphate dikinase